jgi:chromosome segregation ATPase
MKENQMEKDMYEDQIKKLRSKLIELENRLIVMGGENERLVKELDINRQEFHRQEEEFTSQISHIRQVEQSARLKLEAEQTAMDTQMLQMRQKLTDVENKYKILKDDNEKCALLVVEKSNEIEKLRSRNIDLDNGHFQEMEEMRLQLEAYKKNNLDSREMALRYGGEKMQLETQVRQQKQINDGLKNEMTKLSELIASQRRESDELVREMERMRRDLYNVSNENSQLLSDHSKKEERIQVLQKELDHMRMARDSYQQELERNGLELARRHQELTQKIAEIDRMRGIYEETMNKPREISPIRLLAASQYVTVPKPAPGAFINTSTQVINPIFRQGYNA